MMHLRLKLHQNFPSRRTREHSERRVARLGTDEVAPLLPGGEQDLRFSAVPQGRGLRHGGRSRGRFHHHLRKRGGGDVRRRHILGQASLDGLKAFPAQRHNTPRTKSNQFLREVLLLRLFNRQVAGNKKKKDALTEPLRPLPHCSGSAMATSASAACCHDL